VCEELSVYTLWNVVNKCIKNNQSYMITLEPQHATDKYNRIGRLDTETEDGSRHVDSGVRQSGVRHGDRGARQRVGG